MTDASNQPNADDLTRFNISDLLDCRYDVERGLKAHKDDLARIDAEITRRFGSKIDAALKSADKQAGSITVDLGEGFRAKGAVAKKVTYDQDKLRAAAGQMTWDEANHYFDIKMSVPEKVYGALAPADPHKPAIEAARTVVYGDLKVSLERVEK